MATMRDVAREAGTSVTTVSNVINGTRPVSPNTNLRVRLAMKKLGYHPNAVAQSLRKQKSKCLGVVVADIGNPFFAELVHGAEQCARRYGYACLICNTDEAPDVERSAVEMLESRRADGLLVAPTNNSEDILRGLIARGMKCVLVDRYMDSTAVSAVVSDSRAGAREAVAHLMELGHREIAIVIGSLGLSTSRERLQGYKEVLEEHGIPVRDELVVHADGRLDTTQLLVQLLERGMQPTSIFATNNPRTIGTMNALRITGLRCPDDISVVGFDDSEWAEAFNPPLTIVAQDPFQMGNRAAARLISILDSRTEACAAQVERIPVRLVQRASTRAIKSKGTSSTGG